MRELILTLNKIFKNLQNLYKMIYITSKRKELQTKLQSYSILLILIFFITLDTSYNSHCDSIRSKKASITGIALRSVRDAHFTRPRPLYDLP